MPKVALSLTLERDNLLWLRSQAAAAKRRSLSQTVDELISSARLAGRVPGFSIRSVVGTVDVTGDDPLLSAADDHIRSVFDASIRRPLLVRESPPPYGKRPRGRRRG
jgi:hypothetical protein